MTRRSEDAVLAFGRRSAPWLVGGLLLGLAAGGGIVLATPAVAHATTVIELTPVSPEVELGSETPLHPITVDTDAQLLTSDEVVRAAAAAAGRTPVQAREALSVTAEQLTRVLNITYTDRSPKAAQAGAERAAVVFLQARERLILEPVRAALVRLGAVIDTTDPAVVPASPDRPGVDLATPAGRQLAAVAAELALTGPGEILKHALALPATDRGSTSVPLGSAAGVGALLLFGVGLLRDRRRSAASFGTPLSTGVPGPTDVPDGPGDGEERAGGTALGTVTLRPSGRRLLRPLVAALVLGLVGLGVGVVAAGRVDARPSGDAKVLIAPLPGNAFSVRDNDNSVDLQTEAAAVTSDTVLAKVLPTTGGSVLALRRRVKAEVVPGAEVLSVSVRGQDPGRSLGTARAIAQAVIDVRRDRAAASYAAQTTLLQKRIDETQASLTATQAPGGDTTLSSVFSERLVSLRETLRALPTDLDAGDIVDTSTVAQPKRKLLRKAVPVAAAAAAGLLGWLLGGVTPPSGRQRSRRSRRGSALLTRTEPRWS